MFKKLKQKINRFLDRLAKANQETFGTQPLDCCTLEKRENSESPKR
ncbi:MAG: LDCC motif putative metal-binding protein [Eubacteriales bacterium]|nr:LDCC motif putative metal-binding protein [Eubacteriales bacterium]